jgi:hypothetical protein
MAARALYGVAGAVGAVALLLAIGLLLSARNPYGPAFSHPWTLIVGALAGLSLAVLPRSWPATMRVATAGAAAVVALAVVIFFVSGLPAL